MKPKPAAFRKSRIPPQIRVAGVVLLTLGFFLPATRITAQEGVAPTAARRAILTGVAMDSIRGGYLRGASVFISGTALSATTDSSGRFRIDGIPAGTRLMEIQHPLLDSLAISLNTKPQAFNDGDSSFVMVSVPSARTLVASTCSADERAKGPALIVGMVTNGDSGNPSIGASVSVGWTDYEIAKKSIRSTPHRRVVPVSPTGSFRMCGLPDDLVAAVVASRGNDSTAAVELNLASLVGIVSLKLPPPRVSAVPGSAAPDSTAPDSAAPTLVHGSAFISGRVVDAEGKPSRGARVAIEADDAVVNTGPDGTFTLAGLRPGTRRLSVRKIGYEPVEKAVDLAPDGITNLRLALGRSVAVLKAMVVRATRDAGLQRVGFTDRRTRRPGVFLGPREVEIRNGARLGELLRDVPLARRRGCTRYFIDGFRQAPGDPDEYLSGFEIGAVEVYSTGFVPPEFASYSSGGQPCKSIVVWTKWKIDRR